MTMQRKKLRKKLLSMKQNIYIYKFQDRIWHGNTGALVKKCTITIEEWLSSVLNPEPIRQEITRQSIENVCTYVPRCIWIQWTSVYVLTITVSSICSSHNITINYVSIRTAFRIRRISTVIFASISTSIRL